MIARLIREHDRDNRLEGFLNTKSSRAIWRRCSMTTWRAEIEQSELRDVGALLGLAGGKRTRAFVARPYVQTIEHAEVRVADDLQAPEQSQTECAAGTASHLQDERAPAQRRHLNIDLDFFFAGFHHY